MGRQELLSDTVAHVRRHGIGGTTLRQLADAIGTSHRMLLYHFGSREGLLAAAVAAIEEDERAAAAAAVADARTVDEVLRRSWERLSAPERAGEERLFFELAALCAQGTPGTEQLRDEFVEPWLAAGGDDEARRAALRVDIAVLRGLLLDLLVTGDRDGTAAAFERYRALRGRRRAP